MHGTSTTSPIILTHVKPDLQLKTQKNQTRNCAARGRTDTANQTERRGGGGFSRRGTVVEVQIHASKRSPALLRVEGDLGSPTAKGHSVGLA